MDANGNVLWDTDGVSLCVTTQNQYVPQIASDGSGGAIVTWEDARSGDANYDIYAQRVYSDGAVAWTEDGVSLCAASIHQFEPQIVSDGAGGAIVTWEDRRSGITNYDIYAQRVDGDGNTLWQTDGVSLCVASSMQLYPQIASDGAGGAIVTWEDYRNSATTGYDVYAQRVDNNGNVLWQTDGMSICVESMDQQVAQIVSDGSEGAIVTWEDDRDYGTNGKDIYAQRVDSDGNVLWQTDGVSLCIASYDQYVPQIVSDGLWGAIVTWEDNRLNGYRAIYAQRVGGVADVRLPLVTRKYP